MVENHWTIIVPVPCTVQSNSVLDCTGACSLTYALCHNGFDWTTRIGNF